jgi:hypothetical protein
MSEVKMLSPEERTADGVYKIAGGGLALNPHLSTFVIVAADGVLW